jgi:RimJ/RimL family protein N-acetyltransferase
MKDSFLLLSDALPGVSLRTAALSDCEHLRLWKNAHRGSFFFREIITADGQRAWFEGYLERPDDWMFVVLVGDEPIGCMGFRLREGQADVYNVILGRSENGGRGVMARALQLMCSYARARLRCEIVARVLKSNPAMSWYLKRGFNVVSEEDTHYLVKLAADRFVPVAVTQEEIKE